MIILIIVGYRFWTAEPAPPAPERTTEGDYRVERVVDGDTIKFVPHRTVRLIGVDTPETVKAETPVQPFGPEATAFTRQFLAGGTARLTFDREREDRFGRTLAYVWVGDQLLQEELLRRGLARHETHFNYSPAMKRRFHKAQQIAREMHLGIWSLNSNFAQPRPSHTEPGPTEPSETQQPPIAPGSLRAPKL